MRTMKDIFDVHNPHHVEQYYRCMFVDGCWSEAFLTELQEQGMEDIGVDWFTAIAFKMAQAWCEYKIGLKP